MANAFLIAEDSRDDKPAELSQEYKHIGNTLIFSGSETDSINFYNEDHNNYDNYDIIQPEEAGSFGFEIKDYMYYNGTCYGVIEYINESYHKQRVSFPLSSSLLTVRRA